MFNNERNNMNEPFKIDMYFNIRYYAKNTARQLQDVPSGTRNAERGQIRKAIHVYVIGTLMQIHITNIEQQ